MTDRSWVSPKEAIKRYSPQNGGPFLTRQAIAVALREGVLKCRAGLMWDAKSSDIEAIYSEAESDLSYKKPTIWTVQHAVPNSVWLKSKTWTDDVATWNFSLNIFHLTVNHVNRHKLMLRDVRLSHQGLKRIFEPGRNKGGLISWDKIDKKDSWRQFWLHMIKLASAEGGLLKNAAFGKQGADNRASDIIQNALSDESGPASRQDVKDIDFLIDYLNKKHPFALEDDTIRKEIKFLRQALKLTRKKQN